MSKSVPSLIDIERATEQIRQERETFNVKKKHEEQWFNLRLTMGYTSVILLIVIMTICVYILMNSIIFSDSVLTSAGAALFVDVLGLLIGVWKISLNPDLVGKLTPVTIGRESAIPDAASTNKKAERVFSST